MEKSHGTSPGSRGAAHDCHGLHLQKIALAAMAKSGIGHAIINGLVFLGKSAGNHRFSH